MEINATIARWRRVNPVTQIRLRLSRAPAPEVVAANFVLRGRARRCAELFNAQGKDLLNVGASIGWLERHALQHGARTVTAIDVHSESLDVARKVAPGATFVHGSVLDLPFEADRFDAVTMFDVLEHLPHKTETQALQEVRRVLRPSGVLALSTPHRHWLSTYLDPAFYFGHRHYRRAELRGFLRETGFVVERESICGRVYDLLDLLLYYASRHLRGRECHPFESVRRRADREWQEDDGWNSLLVIANVKVAGPA
jgi:SAM-dependent methyltransferase